MLCYLLTYLLAYLLAYLLTHLLTYLLTYVPSKSTLIYVTLIHIRYYYYLLTYLHTYSLEEQGYLRSLQCWIVVISVERPRKTGKQHRCSRFIGTRELKSHFRVTWPWLSRSRVKLTVLADVFPSWDPTNQENQKQIVVLPLLELEKQKVVLPW